MSFGEANCPSAANGVGFASSGPNRPAPRAHPRCRGGAAEGSSIARRCGLDKVRYGRLPVVRVRVGLRAGTSALARTGPATGRSRSVGAFVPEQHLLRELHLAAEERSDRLASMDPLDRLP